MDGKTTSMCCTTIDTAHRTGGKPDCFLEKHLQSVPASSRRGKDLFECPLLAIL